VSPERFENMSKNTKRPIVDPQNEEPVDPLSREDKFLVSVLDLTGWVQKNRDMAIIGLVFCVLGVSALLYYRSAKEEQVEQATVRLEAIHQAISMSAVEDAKAQLSTFIDRFEGTKQADEGVVLLGRLHLEAEDFLVAISVLESADLPLSSSSGVQANSLLARAFESQGRWADAEVQYLRVAAGANLDFEIRESLEAAARSRTRQMDFTGAASLYQQIIDGLEDQDPKKGFYVARIAEVSESLD
jgi:hypothetical protein